MYDVNSDSCAIARTSNLNEELGQVKFIMSDKTGTLTRNVMKFKRLSIGSRNYGNNEDDEFADASLIEDYRQGDEHSTSILEVLKMMAVCHTGTGFENIILKMIFFPILQQKNSNSL